MFSQGFLLQDTSKKPQIRVFPRVFTVKKPKTRDFHRLLAPRYLQETQNTRFPRVFTSEKPKTRIFQWFLPPPVSPKTSKKPKTRVFSRIFTSKRPKTRVFPRFSAVSPKPGGQRNGKRDNLRACSKTRRKLAERKLTAAREQAESQPTASRKRKMS